MAKAEWIEAAAWEIADLIDIAFVTRHRDKKHDDIETIILKHCPEDKAGKLAEVLRDIASTDKDLVERIGRDAVINQIIGIVKAAVAKYEKAKK